MTYKKIISVFVLGFLLSVGLIAQNASDALRYSGYNLTGSARFMGLSGATGSIGGDMTSINYNPAGMGIYKSSEYLFAPRYYYNKNESSYGGSYSKSTRDNLNFGMIGMVSSIPLMNRVNPDAAGWKYIQFGFSINRVDNYRENILIEGNSYGGSRVYEWRDQANGNLADNLNPFSSDLAWETYLLDTINGYPKEYITAVPNGGVYQSYSSWREGYKNEMSFAFSGNYDNRLFLGASMAFSFINFYSSTFHSEYALENPGVGEFDEFTYQEELGTRGNGFNAKFGLIYMLTPAIRVNAAFHTPTWFYRMTDTYFTRIDSKMSDGSTYYKSSPNGRYDYELKTPLRAMGGLSIFVADKGFISVDYEYMDYGQASLSASSYSFSDENRSINNDFIATHSLRVGTEWRLQPFLFRAGYGISTSPINTEINEVFHNQYSLGIGYRSGPMFIDFSFMQMMNSQNYYMYDASYSNPAFMESRTSIYNVTIGFKY
ncbi:MAG: hypothetical protein GQ527_09995 [Bacteroidales bacterium]|nr:hypothetical protein [Bacteroidales bacterium]